MSIACGFKNFVEQFTNENGKSLTIRRISSTITPSTGKTSETTSDTETKGLIRSFRTGEIDGTLVQLGDMEVRVAADAISITPEPDTDLVIMDSETWRVVSVGRKYSGDTVSQFMLQVRR